MFLLEVVVDGVATAYVLEKIQVAALAEQAQIQLAILEAELGRIDYVIANAGFGVAGWFHRRTIDDYRRQFETNVFGVLRTAAGSMSALEATAGCLAIMGSVMSFAALPGASPYSGWPGVFEWSWRKFRSSSRDRS